MATAVALARAFVRKDSTAGTAVQVRHNIILHKVELSCKIHDYAEMPSAEPPVLELISAGGREDVPVLLRIFAYTADNLSLSENLEVEISNFPAESSFSTGTSNRSSGVWLFESSDFGDVYLTLPSHFSGEILLNAVARNLNSIREGSLSFTVQPRADKPFLSANATCFDPQTQSANLSIDMSLVDRDGSERLSFSVSGIPQQTALAQLEISDGQYQLQADSITLRNITTTTRLYITSSATETLNNETALSMKVIEIEQCIVETSPTQGTWYLWCV